MASKSPIQQFPPNVDRSYFGAWLSGFTDGEGSFFLRLVKTPGKDPQPFATFRIALRDDDRPILQLVQSYFGVGRLSNYSNIRSKTKGKPVCVFEVNTVADNVSAVIPHFEQFPLLAKKQRDFAIWKEAVCFMDSIKNRTFKHRRDGQRGGFYPKWTCQEREHFSLLMNTLKEQRAYLATPAPQPGPTPARARERTLFD